MIQMAPLVSRVGKEGKPMTDDELGMAWWNALTEQERAKWSRLAGTGRAKDAWELAKGRAKPMPDDPLRDAHIGIGKAIAELRAIGVTVPVTLHRAMHALTYARAERDVLSNERDDEASR